MTDQDLHARFELLKGAEHQKNELITETLRQLDKLNDDYQQMSLDFQRETQYNREAQLRQRKLQEELRLYRAMVACHDKLSLRLFQYGDGMIFEDQMIQKGELGGKDAANKLWNAIRDNVHQTMPSLSAEYKIVTRIYANLKGLAMTSYHAGIVEKPTVMEDFARGFTGSKQLFDFVDVGSGKDRADDKIIGISGTHGAWKSITNGLKSRNF
ncbi:MAG: hypothetical protein Q9167_008085 [Letrouitia subvulpina]